MKIYGDPQAVVVPHSVWDEALGKAEKIGRLRHSWKGNTALHEGIIGQIMFSRLYGGELTEIETHGNGIYHYDVDHPQLKRVEVKTKLNNDEINYASWNWSATIPHYNIDKQIPDYYAFFRLNKLHRNIWFCGYSSREYYLNNCHFIRAGEADPLDPKGKKMPHSCYNLLYSKLERHLEEVTGSYDEVEVMLNIALDLIGAADLQFKTHRELINIIKSLIQTKVDRARKLDTRELSTNGYIASLPSAIKSALGL